MKESKLGGELHEWQGKGQKLYTSFFKSFRRRNAQNHYQRLNRVRLRQLLVVIGVNGWFPLLATLPEGKKPSHSTRRKMPSGLKLPRVCVALERDTPRTISAHLGSCLRSSSERRHTQKLKGMRCIVSLRSFSVVRNCGTLVSETSGNLHMLFLGW